MTKEELQAYMAVVISLKFDSIRDLVLEKNKLYGNAAIEPVKEGFSDLSPADRLRARCDEKLARYRNQRAAIKQGKELKDNESPLADLVGSLVLLMIAEEQEGLDAKRQSTSSTSDRTEGDAEKQREQGDSGFYSEVLEDICGK